MCARAAEMARRTLQWLKLIAQTNPEVGGRLLVNFARECCGAVAEWSEANPSAAKSIAKHAPDWPCVYGLHLAIQEDTLDRLWELGLGASHPVASAITPKLLRPAVTARAGKRLKRKTTKGIDLRKPANRQAAMIFDCLTESRATFEGDQRRCAAGDHVMPGWRAEANALPPLSYQSAEAWFEVGWKGCRESEIIDGMTDKHGMSLGDYRRFHKETGREATNVRQGARELVRKAFLTMVRRHLAASKNSDR